MSINDVKYLNPSYPILSFLSHLFRESPKLHRLRERLSGISGPASEASKSQPRPRRAAIWEEEFSKT